MRAGVIERFLLLRPAHRRAALQPVGILFGHRDEFQRVFHRIGHRAGLGRRRRRFQRYARSRAVVHLRRDAARRSIVGQRADKRFLAAPLVIEPVGSQLLRRRRMAFGPGAEVAGHQRTAVQHQRLCLRVEVRHPYVPAPQQFVVCIVGSYQCVALLDAGRIVFVGTYIERAFLPVEMQVLHQLRRRLPDDSQPGRGQFFLALAFVQGVEQVFRLFLVRQIAVGRVGAQVFRSRNAHEQGARSHRAATARHAGQHHRARRRRLALYGGRGRHRQGLLRRVHFDLFPARRTGGHRKGPQVDVVGRESHRRRAALRQIERRAVETDVARLLLLAARRQQRRSHRSRGRQSCQ